MAPLAPVEMTLLPGARALLAAHAREMPQRDDLCGAFCGALALWAAGLGERNGGTESEGERASETEGERNDQDAVAQAAGSTVSAVADVGHLPHGERGRRDYRLTLPRVEDGAVSGTTAAGVVRSIEALSDGALAAVPYSGPWTGETLGGLFEAVAASEHPTTLIANIATRHLWGGRPNAGQLLDYLYDGALDGPPPDWDVGHFVCVFGRMRGPKGSLYGVADTYPALGNSGVHVQPAERLAAALARPAGPAGGVVVVVTFEDLYRVRVRAREIGLVEEAWDNASVAADTAGGPNRAGGPRCHARSPAGGNRGAAVSSTELVALVCCDLGGLVRGRALFASELEKSWRAGVSWVPANHSLTPHGPLAEHTPFGSTGDLRLLPDPDTHVRIEGDAGASALDFVLCDIVETDGKPWECCPRHFLRAALEELERTCGARANVSFEHEFQLLADTPPAAHDTPPPAPFSLEALRRAEPFAADAMAALDEAGAQPERFFPEFAANQFEVPVAAAEGVAAADRAVVLREVVREVARRRGRRVTFAPLTDPTGPGNGVHVHVSLSGADGEPLLYDEARPACLSELGGSFAAGVLRHAGALSALSAPSPASAARLTPHRWSAGAVCLAERNREALLRIPPVVALADVEPAAQLRLEYRGADATANPYIALGALVRAGTEGVREKLPQPPLLDRDPAQLDATEAKRWGVGALPASLKDALGALAEDEAARAWMGPTMYDAYTGIKRAEVDAVADMDVSEVCSRYAAIY